MTRIGDLHKVDTPMVGINKELEVELDEATLVKAEDVSWNPLLAPSTRPLTSTVVQNVVDEVNANVNALQDTLLGQLPGLRLLLTPSGITPLTAEWIPAFGSDAPTRVGSPKARNVGGAFWQLDGVSGSFAASVPGSSPTWTVWATIGCHEWDGNRAALTLSDASGNTIDVYINTNFGRIAVIINQAQVGATTITMTTGLPAATYIPEQFHRVMVGLTWDGTTLSMASWAPAGLDALNAFDSDYTTAFSFGSLTSVAVGVDSQAAQGEILSDLLCVADTSYADAAALQATQTLFQPLFPGAIVKGRDIPFFVSTEQTGSGAEQTISTELGYPPANVLIMVTEVPDAAAEGGFDTSVGTVANFSVKCTVTNTVKYRVLAF